MRTEETRNTRTIYFCFSFDFCSSLIISEADIGLLQRPRWSALCFHLGCCSSPRSASQTGLVTIYELHELLNLSYQIERFCEIKSKEYYCILFLGPRTTPLTLQFILSLSFLVIYCITLTSG